MPPELSPADVLEAILGRRHSCRAFLDRPVPAELIHRLFSQAQRTASWCNSQAWSVHLTGPEETARFAAALGEQMAHGRPSPDIEPPGEYVGVYRDRRRASGFGLYGALGIARDDIDARRRQLLENSRFFGAPHVAVISSPRSLGVYGAVDCGGYVSTLLTVAQSLGLASIAQAAVAMHSGFVREYLGIPDDRWVVCAVSFGYPDEEHPANAFRTERVDIGEVVQGLPG